MTKKEQYIVNKFKRSGHFTTTNNSIRLGQIAKYAYMHHAHSYTLEFRIYTKKPITRAFPPLNFYRLMVKLCSTLSSNQPDSGDRGNLRGLLQSGNSIISGLGVEVRVEEQRVAARSPRILITHTPNGDTDTLGGVQASFGNL
jgi:hypothetical protein